MKFWTTLARIADSLERIRDLLESYIKQQGLRVPLRQPVDEEPEPFALSTYDPLLEARREQAANNLFITGNFASWEDAYERVLADEERITVK